MGATPVQICREGLDSTALRAAGGYLHDLARLSQPLIYARPAQDALEGAMGRGNRARIKMGRSGDVFRGEGGAAAYTTLVLLLGAEERRRDGKEGGGGGVSRERG